MQPRVQAAIDGSLKDLEDLLWQSLHRQLSERMRGLLAPVWYTAMAEPVEGQLDTAAIYQLRVATLGLAGLCTALSQRLIPKTAVEELWPRAMATTTAPDGRSAIPFHRL